MNFVHEQDLKVNDFLSENKTEFKYLGVTNYKGQQRKIEINNIHFSFKNILVFGKVLKSELLLRKTKLSIYPSIIIPLIVVGVRNVSKRRTEKEVIIFENRILIKIVR